MSDQRPRGRGRPSFDAEQPSTSSGKRPRESSDNNGGEEKRHASDKSRAGAANKRKDRYIAIANTKPHNNATRHDGPENRVTVEANYFALQSRNTIFAIYKYHVTFEPECLMRGLKTYLVAVHKSKIGGYLFDGSQIFATRPLHEGESREVEFTSETRDQQVYKVKLLFTNIINMNARESLQVLNLLLRRNMTALNLQLVGRNFYDPQNMIDLRQFKIQLWPGYETSIRYHEGKQILLNCDVAHKVMRTDTVYDLLREVSQSNPSNFQNAFRQKILGMTVLTAYNNKTYRIDDIDFDKTPATTFKKKDTEISIQQYYAEKYEIHIRDVGQPLLISQPRARDLRGGQQKPAWLVPELCRITGLNERQRSDMNLKQAMRPYSQMDPRIRKQRLMDFNRRIQSSEEHRKIGDEFGLQVKQDLVQIDAYCIKARKLYFGNDQILPVRGASWDRECGRAPHVIYHAIDLARWIVICPYSMERDVKQFVNRLKDLSISMNLTVNNPKVFCVNADSQLVPKIDEVANMNPKMVLVATTTDSRRNSDLYASIKKKCYSDHALSSQVLTRRILSSPRAKYDSIATKVAIQMCAKLGGAPWVAHCPLKESMTIGFDVVRDTNNRNINYGCLVATMDLRQGANFFSAASRIDGQDCSRELAMNVFKALHEYERIHNALPKFIFIYRGGVGEGDLDYVNQIEKSHLETKLKERYDSIEKQLKLVYIIVSKKTNTRLLLRNGNDYRNPEPGTVVDNTITLDERYEFFLVSQRTSQGTVSPTNYNVIGDSSGLTPEQIQTFTYMQCHMYYNWYGTTRVPAVLQYANKMGFLLSNYMHRVPNECLSDKLFFL